MKINIINEIKSVFNGFKNAVLGIATEILYTLAIMAMALLICLSLYH